MRIVKRRKLLNDDSLGENKKTVYSPNLRQMNKIKVAELCKKNLNIILMNKHLDRIEEHQKADISYS